MDLAPLLDSDLLAGGRWLAECESTNTLLLTEDMPTPYLLGADNQTAGRGRPGKSWSGGLGCLTFSLAVSDADVRTARELIELHEASPVVGVSSLAVGAAVCEAVNRMLPGRGELPMVKWPNDVLVGGRKLAGVLVERRGERTVIGVGLNVSNEPPAGGTSLKAAYGVAPAMDVVLASLVFRLLDEGLRWDDEILGMVRARDALFGREITVSGPDEAVGTAHGITSRGELIVEGRFVSTGSVHLVG